MKTFNKEDISNGDLLHLVVEFLSFDLVYFDVF